MIDKLKAKIFDFEQGTAVFCCLITAAPNADDDLDIDIQIRHHGIDEETRQAIVAEALVVLAEQHGLAPTSNEDGDAPDEDE